MSGGVNSPPLFFPDFKESRETKANWLPVLSPSPQPDAVKYLHWKHFPEHSPKKKDGKAFGNMKDDYGNNSINEKSLFNGQALL